MFEQDLHVNELFWLILSFIFVLCLSDEFQPFYFQFNAIFLFLSYLISMCKVFLQNKSCFTFTSLTYKLPTKNAQSCYYIFFPNHRNTKNRMIQNYSWHTTNRTYLKLVNRFTIIRKFSSETQYLDDGCLKQCVEGRGLQLQEL